MSTHLCLIVLNFTNMTCQVVELGHIGLMLSIFLRSIWVATASRPNHTFYRKVYINEFVANALHDNIESKKSSF